ncbi:RHD domain-containing protein [Pleurotus pulmonarius]
MSPILPLDVIILIAGHFDCKDIEWTRTLGCFRLASRTLRKLLDPLFFKRVYIRTARGDTADQGQATRFLRAVENSSNARHVGGLVFNAVADDQNLSINEILSLLPSLRTLVFISFTDSHSLPTNAPFSLTHLIYTHTGVPIEISKFYAFLSTQTSIEHLDVDIETNRRRGQAVLPSVFLTLPKLRILYGGLFHIYPVLTGSLSDLSHLWVTDFEKEIAERVIANSTNLQSITFFRCDGMDDTMPALFSSLLSNLELLQLQFPLQHDTLSEALESFVQSCPSTRLRGIRFHLKSRPIHYNTAQDSLTSQLLFRTFPSLEVVDFEAGVSLQYNRWYRGSESAVTIQMIEEETWWCNGVLWWQDWVLTYRPFALPG